MNESDFLKSILGGKFIVITKKVKSQRCSGVIYVPRDFIGKEVTILLLDESKELIPIIPPVGNQELEKG